MATKKIVKKDLNVDKEYDIDREKSILDELDKRLEKKEPIIQLFDMENVKFKAFLTEEQRNIIAILMGCYNEAAVLGKEINDYIKNTYKKDLKITINISSLKQIINEFVDYSPSLDGKRAEQFVQAHQSQVQNFMPPNFMGNQGGYGQYSDKMQQMRR